MKPLKCDPPSSYRNFPLICCNAMVYFSSSCLKIKGQDVPCLCTIYYLGPLLHLTLAALSAVCVGHFPLSKCQGLSKVIFVQAKKLRSSCCYVRATKPHSCPSEPQCLGVIQQMASPLDPKMIHDHLSKRIPHEKIVLWLPRWVLCTHSSHKPLLIVQIDIIRILLAIKTKTFYSEASSMLQKSVQNGQKSDAESASYDIEVLPAVTTLFQELSAKEDEQPLNNNPFYGTE